MATLTSLMNISRQALMSDQAALNITANNVMNQNTAGYTREVVNFQSGDSVTLSGGAVDEGVSTSETSQRDRILEQTLQQQTQITGQSGALESALQQVENIFNITSTQSSATSTPLSSAIDSFFSSLSALAGNPSDPSTRQAVLSAANNLSSTFNSAAAQLNQVQSNLDQQVGSTVEQINALTSTIADLNQKITSTSPNQDAGSLEDQRQLAITQLSQLVGLDQISNENNGMTLTTSNGTVLVAGNQSFALSTSKVGGVTDVISKDGQNITAGLTGGSLGGVIQARDQVLPGYASSLDDLAYAIGTAVNQQNEAGVDGNGSTGQAIFTIPTSAAGAATSIQVAMTDPKGIAAASTGEGSSANDNAQAMANLSTSNIANGQTASGFLASFYSQVGSDAASATSDNTAQQAVLTQLTTQRDSISGVSLDEEAENMSQYQRSYQAAAQVFQIVNSLMASALNLGEPATVS
jgi:flagellar hook-associated protein 1 FlgK